MLDIRCSIVVSHVVRNAFFVALWAASVCVLLVMADRLGAQAAEVRVLSATSMAPVVDDLTASFARKTRHSVVVRFVPGPVAKRELAAGTPFDVVISIAPVIDALIKEGKLLGETRADIAYAGIGVGVRPGAPKPDIRSVDGFKRALLHARSVAYSAEGASGVHFKSVLERLGIAEAMTAKLRPLSGEGFAKALRSGEVDMVVVTIPVITAYGAELVGPLPPEVQFHNRFAAAVSDRATDIALARAFVQFLTTPEAVAIIKARGMQPGVPR